MKPVSMSPLVTIIITTYNSSQFLLETLESVFEQTWEELELIITDDCSNDNTVEICRKWLNEYTQRFSNVELLTSEFNTGVSANANRGLHMAKGDWIKFLGADDTLKPECIEDNMLWTTSHPDIKVLFSKIEIYKDTFKPQNIVGIIPVDPYIQTGIMADWRSAESQYRMLLVSDRIHFSPSVFLNRDLLYNVGGFDEQFKMLEDYPLWLKLTKNGYRLYFMDKLTVRYRRHSRAINNTGINNLVNPNYFGSEVFRKLLTYPHLPADIRLNQRFTWIVSQLFRFGWINRNNKFNRFFRNILTHYLNPFKYYIWFKRRLNKNLNNNEFYL
jgi:glycosyltransferase involved in cell wall biosynthesis